MSRFFVAMFVGAIIAAAASTSASAWHCLAQQPQRRSRHGLRRHTGKGAVNFIAPVHTPRRWGWLHNRMVPAVLRGRTTRRMRTRRTQSARIKCKLRLRKRPSCREARGGYRTPFPIACRDAIRLSLPQAKVLDRRRQGFGLVALAVARDLCRIPLKAVVVQDFAIGS